MKPLVFICCIAGAIAIGFAISPVGGGIIGLIAGIGLGLAAVEGMETNK